MSSLKNIPASARYLKARLRVFNRPRFWFASVVLVLVLLLAWEYAKNPAAIANFGGDKPEASEEAAVDSEAAAEEASLSADEFASIGANADIDSSSVLKQLFDLQIDPVSLPVNLEGKKPQAQGLFEILDKQQQEAAKNSSPAAVDKSMAGDKPGSSNPFLVSAEQFLNFGLMPSSNPLASSDRYAAGNFINPFLNANGTNAPSANPAAMSPLQSALLNQTAQVNNNAAAVPDRSQPNTQLQSVQGASVPTAGMTYPANYLPGQAAAQPISSYGVPYNQGYVAYPNSYTYLNPPQSGILQPQTAPITPQAVPVAPVNYPQAATQIPAVPNGAVNPNFAAPQTNLGTQPGQFNQPANFTAPRPIPGSYIGGGQINTFANP